LTVGFHLKMSQEKKDDILRQELTNQRVRQATRQL
jgi:hypothetical protein